MKALFIIVSLFVTISASAQGARQHRSCVNPTGEISLQLYAGPASYGSTPSDVFRAVISGDEHLVVSAEALSAEKVLSVIVSADRSTKITKTRIDMAIELENGITVSSRFTCTQTDFNP